MAVLGWDASDTFKPIIDDDDSSSSSSSEDEEDENDEISHPRGIEVSVVKYKKIICEEELLPE